MSGDQPCADCANDTRRAAALGAVLGVVLGAAACYLVVTRGR